MYLDLYITVSCHDTLLYHMMTEMYLKQRLLLFRHFWSHPSDTLNFGSEIFWNFLSLFFYMPFWNEYPSICSTYKSCIQKMRCRYLSRQFSKTLCGPHLHAPDCHKCRMFSFSCSLFFAGIVTRIFYMKLRSFFFINCICYLIFSLLVHIRHTAEIM